MSKKINRDDIDKFFDYGLDVPNRTIYMGSIPSEHDEESGVDFSMAEYTIKAIHILESLAPEGDKPITIIMNNPGGDYYHGMAIYDAIKNCRNHVTIKVFGHAMSMGSIILQAADERILAKNSRVMIHFGTMGLGHTHTKIFIKWAEETKIQDDEMIDVLLEKIREKNPSFQKKRLQELCNFDTILNSSEAIALGLADKILGED
jgi:ATP-dependent Clp endopeptidase proteolytic subunit ClpP